MSIEDCTTTADYLREYAANPGYSHADYADVMRKGADELERLQRILDSRPAINAGLPETYIEWSQGIYAADYAQAVGHDG